MARAVGVDRLDRGQVARPVDPAREGHRAARHAFEVALAQVAAASGERLAHRQRRAAGDDRGPGAHHPRMVGLGAQGRHVVAQLR